MYIKGIENLGVFITLFIFIFFLAFFVFHYINENQIVSRQYVNDVNWNVKNDHTGHFSMFTGQLYHITYKSGKNKFIVKI